MNAARGAVVAGRLWDDLPVVRQNANTECGHACLVMIARYHGHFIDLGTLARRFTPSLKGTTVAQLVEIAATLDLTGRAVRVDVDQLGLLQLPAILHWGMNHFVVLKVVRGGELVIHDPARGARRVSREEASREVTGIALELRPTQTFKAIDDRAELGLRQAIGRVPGLISPLAQVFLLSLILELFVIASPFYLQTIVDDALPRSDMNLLLIATIGFALLTGINVVATALRSWILLSIQTHVGYLMETRLFAHLVRLPLGFFEARDTGDVISRFASLEPIRKLIAEGIIASAVDALLAILTLAVLCLYNLRLAAITITILLIYLLVRLVLLPTTGRRQDEQIEAQADAETLLIETMRAVQSIKVNNGEIIRAGLYDNRLAILANKRIRLERTELAAKTAHGVLYGLENVLTTGLAAYFVTQQVMSIGMLFAFIAYKQQFLIKVAQLSDKFVELRLVRLHLARVADIALSAPEPTSPVDRTIPAAAASLRLEAVSFTYPGDRVPVLRDININVDAGEYVAITGPSGCGKTTLLKVMMGLLPPGAGTIFVSGRPLTPAGLHAYRSSIGAVMQDDTLLAGSIADNIAFFDPAGSDREWLMDCARIACIHDEILAMPMGYDTIVGDLGSALSGGQKQRVLIARALYRRPAILYLDEGTSHLDVRLEAELGRRLQTLKLTRIHVAHRPQTISSADRVVQLAHDTGET